MASVITAEINDARNKAAILTNWSDIGEIVTPDDFSYSILSEAEIKKQLSIPSNRFVVRISKQQKYRFGLEGFGLYLKPWLIQGSFMEKAVSKFRGVQTDRQNNALTIRTRMAGSMTIWRYWRRPHSNRRYNAWGCKTSIGNLLKTIITPQNFNVLGTFLY